MRRIYKIMDCITLALKVFLGVLAAWLFFLLFDVAAIAEGAAITRGPIDFLDNFGKILVAYLSILIIVAISLGIAMIIWSILAKKFKGTRQGVKYERFAVACGCCLMAFNPKHW